MHTFRLFSHVKCKWLIYYEYILTKKKINKHNILKFLSTYFFEDLKYFEIVTAIYIKIHNNITEENAFFLEMLVLKFL